MQFARLIARALVGGLFVGHGTQKLFGWFNGPGLAGTEQFMESLELRPARLQARAAALSETVGGSLLVLGLLTPLAGSALIATMITAIRTVHFKNGLWAANGGYEFNLALIAATLALIDGGPGNLSIDGALSIEDTGSGWALAALAAGAAGSTLAIEAGRHQSPAADPTADGGDVAGDPATKGS
ncbi:MAG: hypothetical protein NVSMB25_14230 [Thermoleophilaceae bacterium]